MGAMERERLIGFDLLLLCCSEGTAFLVCFGGYFDTMRADTLICLALVLRFSLRAC